MSSPPRSPPPRSPPSVNRSAPRKPPDVRRSQRIKKLRHGGLSQSALKRILDHGRESFTPQRPLMAVRKPQHSKVTTAPPRGFFTEPRPSSHSRTRKTLGNGLLKVTANQAWKARERTNYTKQRLEAVQKSLAENNNGNNGNRPQLNNGNNNNNNVPNVRLVEANQRERQLGQIRKKTARDVFLIPKAKPKPGRFLV